MLQWGRTFSSAERQKKRQQAAKKSRASMGPHFFKCGKRSRTKVIIMSKISFNGAALFQVRKGQLSSLTALFTALLQWGRTFSSAESSDVKTAMKTKLSGFNGAALFQVRKVGECKLNNTMKTSFNGAALFQVRKGGRNLGGRVIKRRASMGPHFFKCGK